MGADIHCYIETARISDTPYWSSLGGGMNPGRDYDLFAKIANVRNYNEVEALGPKGLPDNLGWRAADDDRYRVTDDPCEDAREVSRETAESWIKSECSNWIPLNEEHPEYWVSDPDNHSHTWLTAKEFRDILELPRPNGWVIDAEYYGILAMMEEIERRERQVRLIIWFDN